MRDLFRTVVFAAVATAVAACTIAGGGATGPPSASGSPPAANVSAVPGELDALRYSCGRFPFEAALITAPARTDEDAPAPFAAALRAHLAIPGPDTDFLPDHGWTLAGADAAGAEYVTLGGELGMKSVSVELGPAGWKVTGWGDCRPRLVLPPGVGDAEWTWGGPGAPGPDTRRFEALVSEMSCAGGQSPLGRILGPDVIATADSVIVIFAVRQLGGAQTCPGIAPTRVAVDLGQALGNRTLLDGGRLPYGDPMVPTR
jgi:hypothetical protein